MEFSILQVYLHCCWSNCPLTPTLHTCVQLCVEHSNSFVLFQTRCVFYFLHQKVLKPHQLPPYHLRTLSILPFPPKSPKNIPKSPPDPPRTSPNHPQSVPRSSKNAPRSLQSVPKLPQITPACPQIIPECDYITPRPQRAPKLPQISFRIFWCKFWNIFNCIHTLAQCPQQNMQVHRL